MEVKVADIQPEGMRVSLTEEPSGIGVLGEDIKVVRPVEAKFSLKKVGTTVYLEGEIGAEVELGCSRCGEKYRTTVKSAFEMDMNPIESAPAAEERELKAGDLEVEFFKDGIIDLLDVIREQILLQVPMKPLCREDCKGLCPFCGQDLNIEKCACEPPKGHPGFAGLKDFFKKDGKE